MGKNKRKKKQKVADFKKVKLKVGKKLPKGANETQTSFKSRGIVIPSQDLTKEGQLTNTRKQSLKDLIPHLSHYSPSVRKEALLGLRSLFQQHTHLFHENLSLILSPVAAKMTDTDSDVRHSLLLLFRSILPHLPPDQAAPFLPLLVAHLSCAMSHIYEDIQLESLEFFSLFLEFFPRQISASSSQLLDNFVGLISQHSGGAIGQKTSKGSTKIAVNPKGKLSSPKARLKILTQLYEFLRALHAENTVQSQAEFMLDSVSINQGSRFSQTRLTHRSLLNGNDEELNLSLFSFGDQTTSPDNSGPISNNTREVNGNSDVKDFMQKIVPLLLEFWVECSPSQLSTSLPDNALPAVNLSIMLTVMNILKVLLHKLIKLEEENSGTLRNWLVTQYFKDFNIHFLKLFPFQDSSSSSKGKGKNKFSEISSDNLALMLNISVCEVMSYFVDSASVSAKQTNKYWMEQLEDFVVQSLEQIFREKVSLDHLKSLLVYVEKVLQEVTNQEESNSAKRILDALYKLYKSSHLLSGVRNLLLTFFAALIRKQRTIYRTQQEIDWQGSLKEWMQSLPKMLPQLKTSSPETTHTVLQVLSRLMKQSVDDIDLKDLQKQLNCFLDPASGPFCKLRKEIQCTAVELLFTLPVIDNYLLQTLALCCHQHLVPVDIIKYLIQVLHYRSPASSGFLDMTLAFNLSSFLSFLFSVAIGYTKKDLHQFQTINGKTAFSSSYKIVEDVRDDRTNYWTRHQDILQAVCREYGLLQDANQLLHLMEPILKKTLKENRVLPLTVADSLLQLCTCYCLLSLTTEHRHSGCMSPSLLSSLAELSFSCLLYSTHHAYDTMESNSDIGSCLFGNVMQLMIAHPSVLEKLLDELLSKTSDLSSDITVITTKILRAFGECNHPEFYSEAVATLINNIVEKQESQESQSSHFSEMAYQCSLYCIEVKRRKKVQML